MHSIGQAAFNQVRPSLSYAQISETAYSQEKNTNITVNFIYNLININENYIMKHEISSIKGLL